jgi:oxygen-dependent protoporphyrinogen oxidase
MTSVAIVGGGITGLSAAFWLKKAGIPFTLYEAGPRCGGVIQTITRDGFIAEAGPNTILETSPRIPQMVEELGLASERIYTAPEASNRYIVRNGRMISLPASPLQFFTTKAFSLKAKLHLLAEPFISRACGDESVANFVRRRLGQEFLDYAIEPLVAGIYAGDPEKLSVHHGFPRLRETEQRYGSLILGQILGARERRKTGKVSKQDAPKFSFRGGLQTFLAALETHCSSELRLEHPLEKITYRDSAFDLQFTTTSGRYHARHSALLLTSPAYKSAQVTSELPLDADLNFLSDIRYAPVVTISLGFKREDIHGPIDGFGVLVPRREPMRILGAVFPSSLFPNRAPHGAALLTCFLGGERSPGLAHSPPQQLLSLVKADLHALLGISAPPVFQSIHVFPRAIPQYELGYGRIVENIARVETAAPGLFLAGNYRGGISLSDSILNGEKAARKVQNFLSALRDPQPAHSQS